MNSNVLVFTQDRDEYFSNTFYSTIKIIQVVIYYLVLWSENDTVWVFIALG